jgi:general secretion pathway protein D
LKLSHTPIYLTCLFFSACGTQPITPAANHIRQTNTNAQQNNVDIPQANKNTLPLAPPKPTAKIETYSVVVSNVPAQEILFALARDAKINLDISSGIQGNVSINAINQTLPQILDRISKQVDMRYELDNGTLAVMPDKPFLKTYKIDFINMTRTTKSTNSTSSQIGSTGAAGAGNNANTLVSSDTKNDLMESLVKNVTDIILEEDRLRQKSQKEISSANRINAQGDGVATGTTGSSSNKGKSGSGESGPAGAVSGAGNETVQASGSAKATTAEVEKSVSVFANKETGVLIARATARQHEKIQEFIDHVMTAAKRQVLIETTIVEVELNDRYRQGIDWSAFGTGAEGLIISQTALAGVKGVAGALTIASLNKVVSSVTLLEEFGNVKVLSSPRLTVMNNQTASLKVADSEVYFTVTTTPPVLSPTGTIISGTTYTTTPITVSVGLNMSVTPQISDGDTITLNVRPSISRVLSYAKDPNPTLANPCSSNTIAAANADSCKPIDNPVPKIQTREMESIIKVESGQTAVMGGLIQEYIIKSTSEVPWIARIPLLGQLFQNRDDKTRKSELVIFLRPIVIKDASINADYKDYSNNLPKADFFHEDARGAYQKP